METIFCHCGRVIKDGLCPKHGKDYIKEVKRTKIGKWSGPSKTPYGSYENR